MLTIRKALALSLLINALFLVSFGILVVRRFRSRNPSPFTSSPLYKTRVAAFESLPTHNGALVFAGDSLIEFERWDELLGRSGVLNRGIAGDNIEGLTSRIQEIARHNPKVLFLMIGTNDVWEDRPEKVIGSYRSLLSLARQEMPESRIIVAAILPVNTSLTNKPDLNQRITRTNVPLKQLADEFRCEYVDFGNLVIENGELSPKYSDDGLHLNGAGYLRLKDAINALL